MPTLDTRLNWDAIEAVASGQAATGQDDLPAAPSDPRAELWRLLDIWAGMDEAAWTQEAVDRLKDQILDLFKAYPIQAEGWYQQWRATFPEARLAVRRRLTPGNGGLSSQGHGSNRPVNPS